MAAPGIRYGIRTWALYSKTYSVCAVVPLDTRIIYLSVGTFVIYSIYSYSELLLDVRTLYLRLSLNLTWLTVCRLSGKTWLFLTYTAGAFSITVKVIFPHFQHFGRQSELSFLNSTLFNYRFMDYYKYSTNLPIISLAIVPFTKFRKFLPNSVRLLRFLGVRKNVFFKLFKKLKTRHHYMEVVILWITLSNLKSGLEQVWDGKYCAWRTADSRVATSIRLKLKMC